MGELGDEFAPHKVIDGAMQSFTQVFIIFRCHILQNDNFQWTSNFFPAQELSQIGMVHVSFELGDCGQGRKVPNDPICLCSEFIVEFFGIVVK